MKPSLFLLLQITDKFLMRFNELDFFILFFHFLQIFGIKTLVKSYLPVKDAHLRLGIDSLLDILKNILSFGEISKDIESR